MTRTIEQRDEPFSPYGVQFWSSNRAAVEKALEGIRRVVDEENPENYTIRILDTQVDDHTISQMSFGSAIEAMKYGKKVTRPCFEGIFDGIMLAEQALMTVKGNSPTHVYTPTSEDVLAQDWQITSK